MIGQAYLFAILDGIQGKAVLQRTAFISAQNSLGGDRRENGDIGNGRPVAIHEWSKNVNIDRFRAGDRALVGDLVVCLADHNLVVARLGIGRVLRRGSTAGGGGVTAGDITHNPLQGDSRDSTDQSRRCRQSHELLFLRCHHGLIHDKWSHRQERLAAGFSLQGRGYRNRNSDSAGVNGGCRSRLGLNTCFHTWLPVSLAVVHKPVGKLLQLDARVGHDLCLFLFSGIRMGNVLGAHQPGLEVIHCFCRQTVGFPLLGGTGVLGGRAGGLGRSSSSGHGSS